MKKQLILFFIIINCIRYKESLDDPMTKEGAIKHYYSYILNNNQEKNSYTIDKIIMYRTNIMYDGNLDGTGPGTVRQDVDTICRNDLPTEYNFMQNVRAFISINETDQISSFPSLYGVPTNVPILGPDSNNPNRMIGNNWNDLLDNTIQNTLENAIGGTNWYWWSGSNSDGSFPIAANNSCSNWTTNSSDYGNEGYSNTTTNWIYTGYYACNVQLFLLCISW